MGDTESSLSLKQIQQMARSGTPGLALKLLDAQHPGLTKGSEEWFRWSRARTEILVARKSWELADQHLRDLPAELPESLQRWALSQRAWLLLESDRAPSARELLRELIWQYGARAQDTAEESLWRRMVIRSYMLEDRIDDAATAMHRYQQDFAGRQAQWLQLRARILLRQGRADIVLELPPEAVEKLSSPIRLLAQLRSGQIAAEQIIDATRKLIDDEATTAAEQARLYKIITEAAQVKSDFPSALSALEHALELADELPLSDKLFAVSSDELWRVYQSYGEILANQSQLLVGDDVGWINEIRTAVETNALVRAKSLIVAMIAVTQSHSRRAQLMVQLANVLNVQYGNWRVVERLFLHSDRFPEMSYVPESVRAALVEQAIERSDMVLASNLLASLRDTGTAADLASNLRRARVMIFGGRADAGFDVLNGILDRELFLEAEQLDQFMQVIFDLQAAEQHQYALQLFLRLEKERSLPAERRRELFFWLAESYEATRQYPLAALYFMRSATYTNPQGSDLWGQSARYRAAEVLTEAGLLSDARHLYESLLAITADDARRAVLRGKIQQLWVVPADPENVGN
ncbi:MAG: hypothetical protein AAF434_06135 [Pseudomonadota bacterium]